MRFLMVLGLIVGLLWYGYRGLHGQNQWNPFTAYFSTGKATEGAQAMLLNGNPAAAGVKALGSAPAVAGGQPSVGAGLRYSSGVGPSDGNNVRQLVTSGTTVQLHMRDLPDQTWFTAWGEAGVRTAIDTVSRSVTFYGAPAAVAVAVGAFRSLDTLQDSCSLQAWCVYVDSSQVHGWDLSAAIGEALGGASAVFAAPGSVRLTVGGDAITAALNVISDGTLVEVIQNPYVALVHGQEATIESLQEIPIPTAVVSNGLSQSSITYRKVGLQFHVTPKFLGNGRVRLLVSQENGVLGSPSKIDGNDIPVVETQKVATSVEMAVGEGVILGGVATSRMRQAKGLFRDKSDVSRGMLYVVLSTSAEVPKAVAVDEMGRDDPLGAVMSLVPDCMVLPPLDDSPPWEKPVAPAAGGHASGVVSGPYPSNSKKTIPAKSAPGRKAPVTPVKRSSSMPFRPGK